VNVHDVAIGGTSLRSIAVGSIGGSRQHRLL
jgi:hypothetical protein